MEPNTYSEGQLVSIECQNDLTGCRLNADTVATRYEYEISCTIPFRRMPCYLTHEDQS